MVKPVVKPKHTGSLDKILKLAIYPYHLLTARQITRLLYPTEKLGNLTAVQTRLKALTDAHYLTAAHLPTAERVRPFVYCLSQAGRKLLHTEGFEVDIYFHPSELLTYSYGWYMHLLEVNNFLIPAAIIEKSVPAVRLADWLHDFTIAKNPPASLKKDGKLVQITPDGYLYFQHQAASSTRHYRMFLELDRGTESRARIMKKITDYLILLQAGILHKFLDIPPERRLIVLFATTAGANRLAFLRAATRDALKAYDPTIGHTSFRNQLFRFASVPALMQEQPTPHIIFCSPFWYFALDGDTNQATTLIDLDH